MAKKMSKKKSGLLVVDIGNTTVKAGLMRGLTVLAAEAVPCEQGVPALKKGLQAVFQKWARKYDICGSIVCSVVPAQTGLVRALIRKELTPEVMVVGADCMVPMTSRYKVPGRVGPDRIVGAYAAAELFGAPVVVVDLGSAITFDVVSAKKEYLGGIIAPGLRLSAETLFQRTALLPLVRLRRPGALIGRDTESSILSGIFYGYGEMIQGLVRLLVRQVPGKPLVVMTGGLTRLMKNYVAPVIDHVDEDLIFKGLALLAREGQNRR